MKNHILVLGGSTFMGKALLQILSKNQDYDIHYVNRGKKYWNNEVKSIPNIHYSYGNRDDSKDFMLVIKYLSKKLAIEGISNNIYWEAVIDFSAFTYKNIRVYYHFYLIL